MNNIYHYFYCPKTLVVSVLSVFALSCDNIKNTLSFEDSKPIKPLNETTIYNYELVQKVVEDSEEEDKLESKKLFLKGIQLYKKENKKYQSLDYLKKSIVLYPNAKSYYELGNVALQLNFYSEAIRAYKMAERLDYKPIAKLYYKLSTAYSAKKKIDEASSYLKLALEHGYSNIRKLTIDPKLENLKSTEEYRTLMADNVPNARDRQSALFDLFISGFPRVKLPFTISYKDASIFHYEKYIPYDYAELLKNEFTSGDTKELSYVAKVDETDKYVALIYAAIETAEEGEPIVENYLSIFDKKGGLIDKGLISCTCSPEVTLSAVIDEKKEIKLTEFRKVWKYDPEVIEYHDNVLDTVLVRANYYFKISEEGKIKEIEKKGNASLAKA